VSRKEVTLEDLILCKFVQAFLEGSARVVNKLHFTPISFQWFELEIVIDIVNIAVSLLQKQESINLPKPGSSYRPSVCRYHYGIFFDPDLYILLVGSFVEPGPGLDSMNNQIIKYRIHQ